MSSTVNPSMTFPNTVFLPLRCGHLTYVKKNCEALVLGPELAMDMTPRLVCLSVSRISSGNLPPQMDAPPRPVPVGSPPWIMKPFMLRWKDVLS